MRNNSKVKHFIEKTPVWVVVLVVAMGYCLYQLAANNWDPMSFVIIGRQFDPAHGIANMGYDGQFAYQIAIDPQGAIPYLDVPAYRYQRILYPLVARLVSLGSPVVIPWMLIFLNIASLVMGTLATEKILLDHGQSKWFALVYGLFAGQLLSLRADLTEPFAFMLVQWGVLYFDRKKYGWSGLLFALAALTRELTLLFPAACALSLMAGGKHWGAAWGLLTALPFALWQVFLRVWLGSWGVSSGGAYASPFELIPYRGWWGYQTPETLIFVLLSVFVLMVALIPATLGIISGIKKIWQHHWGAGVWILLLNSMIFPFLPTSNVLNPPGLVRVVIGLVVAVLDYGALESSRNALRFSLLWLYLLAFGGGIVAVY